MVTTKMKKIITTAIMLAIWFLLADAYWVSKERDIERCILNASTELIKHSTGQWFFRNEAWVGNGGEYFNASLLVGDHCRWAEGKGNDWNNISGLAYWEILVTLPVIHRYKFD